MSTSSIRTFREKGQWLDRCLSQLRRGHLLFQIQDPEPQVLPNLDYTSSTTATIYQSFSHFSILVISAHGSATIWTTNMCESEANFPQFLDFIGSFQTNPTFLGDLIRSPVGYPPSTVLIDPGHHPQADRLLMCRATRTPRSFKVFIATQKSLERFVEPFVCPQSQPVCRTVSLTRAFHIEFGDRVSFCLSLTMSYLWLIAWLTDPWLLSISCPLFILPFEVFWLMW